MPLREDAPNSMAHTPVPVPMSRTRFGRLMGARQSLPSSSREARLCWRSAVVCQQHRTRRATMHPGSGHVPSRLCSCCERMMLSRTSWCCNDSPATSARARLPHHWEGSILGVQKEVSKATRSRTRTRTRQVVAAQGRMHPLTSLLVPMEGAPVLLDELEDARGGRNTR